MNEPVDASPVSELPDERLRRFLPIRVLVATEPGANHPKCLIEHSFSMDWSADDCLLFWSGKAYSILGEHTLNAEREIVAQQKFYAMKHPKWKVEGIDPLSPESPIQVNWARWLAALETNGSKFGKRNAPYRLSDSLILKEANANYSDVQKEEMARA